MRLDERLFTVASNENHLHHGDFELVKRIEPEDPSDILALFSSMQCLTAEHLQQKSLSRDYFLCLMNAVTQMVFVLDGEDRVVEANQRACDWLGYTIDELSDRAFAFSLLLHGGYIEKWIKLRNYYTGVKSGEETGSWIQRPDVFVIQASNRTEITVELHVHALPKGWGRPPELLVVCLELDSGSFADRVSSLINPAVLKLRLSKDDLHLLELLGQGLTAKEIARQLGKEKRAVERRKRRLIHHHFGVRTSAEMIVIASEYKIIGNKRRG